MELRISSTSIANSSEVGVELVALVAESPDVVLQVPVVVKLSGSFPEHLGVVLLVLDAHVLAHVGLHLSLAHALLRENLRVFGLGPGQDDLGVGSRVQQALLVKHVGLLECWVRIVFFLSCLPLQRIVIEREVLLIRFPFAHQVRRVALFFVAHLSII